MSAARLVILLIGSAGSMPTVARLSDNCYAAIDLGSSSAKLLVVRIASNGTQEERLDHNLVCGLGQDLPASRALPQVNQARALAALRALTNEAETLGCRAADIAVIATAAVRNAPNGDAFVQRIREELSLGRAQVLSGPQEAEIGYLATIASATHGKGNRYASVDLGGGSFELAVGSGQAMERGASTQLGSNDISEHLLRRGPLGAADFARLDAALVRLAPMPLPRALFSDRTVAVAGSVSKFLRAHFARVDVTTSEIDALRRSLGALSDDNRVVAIWEGTTATQRLALGVESTEATLVYGAKLPASLSLLLHIARAIGVTSIHVAQHDARQVLIERDTREAKLRRFPESRATENGSKLTL